MKKHRTTTERLEHLYSLCPPFPCKDGCDSCCGPVPFSLSEWARTGLPLSEAAPFEGLPGAVVSIKRVKKGDTLQVVCRFNTGGGCEIYDARPLICRMYGHTPTLECREGLESEARLDQEWMIERYRRVVAEEAQSLGG